MKKIFFSFFALMLVAINANAENFKQFNAALEEGDYVIAYTTAGKTYAMQATVSKDRLGYADVTPVDGVIENPAAEIVWHIAKAGEYWTIYNASTGKYAGGTGAKNKAGLYDDGTSDNALWTASDAYEFINKLNTDKGVNKNLRNNTTYGFACYATSTGGPLALYKKLGADELASPTISPAGGVYYEAQNVTLTAEEGTDVYYSFDGETYTKYETAVKVAQDATLYAYAQKGDKKSSVASAAYTIAKTYASLADLCQVEPANQPVVVTLTKEEIVEIYTTKAGYRNGIYVMAGDRKIEVFCYDVPETWQVGGLVSGQLKGQWQDYKGQWEVCPSSWDDLTYFEYPTSLQNGQFSAADAVKVGVCTYAKDKAANGTDYAWQVAVNGWDIPANGDARAGGVFQYGSGAWLGGNAFACPDTDKDGNADGACLGLVGVWTGTVQYTQDVKLPAGYYTFSCYVLNTAGGSAFAKNLIGVKYTENGELQENYADANLYTIGQWTKVVIPFQLNAETIVTVSLGYQGANVGSGSSQHLFVDNVELKAGLKPLLVEALNKCNELIAAKENVGDALFQISEAAYNDLIATVAKAQAVADKEDADNDEIEVAIKELDAATETYSLSINRPSQFKEYTLQLDGSEGYLGFADGGIKIVEAGTVRFLPAEDGEFYISSADGSEYVGYLGTNAWTMTADAGYKAPFKLTFVDGKYTIAGLNGCLGVDSYTVGSPFYGDKASTFQFILKEKVIQSQFIKDATQTIAVTRTKGLGATTEVLSYDAAKVCEALGISDIAEAEVFGIESNAGWTFKSVKWFEGAMDEYAGWRNINGEFCAQNSDDAAVCVAIEKKASDNITISTVAAKEPAITAPIYNAYWALATVSKAVMINVQITFVDAEGDNATAISSVKDNSVKAAQVYDLTGRQVKNINRGQIYIINGKKVMLK